MKYRLSEEEKGFLHSGGERVFAQWRRKGFYTVELQRNEPLYNEDPGMTNHVLQPSVVN